MKKGFARILIIVAAILVLVFGAIVYLSKSQKPQTASKSSPQGAGVQNWKTYKNPEGSFIVDYPGGWTLNNFALPNTSVGTRGHTVIQSEATKNLGIKDLGDVDIAVIPTAIFGIEYKNISEQDFFNPNNKLWQPLMSFLGFSTPEEIKVSGKRAMKLIQYSKSKDESGNPKQVITNYYIWAGNSNNEVGRLSFTYNNGNPNKESLIQSFNRILYSFKFTN